MTNGTISSASFAGASAACYANPSPSVGTAFYTFAPVSGACTSLDLQLCAKATTAGWVYINYTVLFANGVKCDKRDSIQCDVIPPSCCEGIKITPIIDAQKCCSQITTLCPVRGIQVDIVGGVLGNVSFAGTSGSLYTGLTGSALTTANFTASSVPTTGLDMMVCPKIGSTPTIIHYIVSFTDGTKCERYDTLKCIKTCCEATEVIKLSTQGKCCSEIKATCPIKTLQ